MPTCAGMGPRQEVPWGLLLGHPGPGERASLIAQGLHGVQTGGPPRGVEAEEDPDEDREEEGHGCASRREDRGDRERPPHGPGEAQAQHDAERAGDGEAAPVAPGAR